MQQVTINTAITDPYSGWATLDDLEAAYRDLLDRAIAEAYPKGMFKVSKFGEADDRLSRAVTALVRSERGLDEAIDDVARWGAPSECVALVCKHHAKEQDAIAQEHGFDDETDVWEHLGGRTSYATAHRLLQC